MSQVQVILYAHTAHLSVQFRKSKGATQAALNKTPVLSTGWGCLLSKSSWRVLWEAQKAMLQPCSEVQQWDGNCCKKSACWQPGGGGPLGQLVLNTQIFTGKQVLTASNSGCRLILRKDRVGLPNLLLFSLEANPANTWCSRNYYYIYISYSWRMKIQEET